MHLYGDANNTAKQPYTHYLAEWRAEKVYVVNQMERYMGAQSEWRNIVQCGFISFEVIFADGQCCNYHNPENTYRLLAKYQQSRWQRI